MDRGDVFKLIAQYLEAFGSSDTKKVSPPSTDLSTIHHVRHYFVFSCSKEQQELRLEFVRIVCEHEHYVPLNLPFMKQTSKHYKGNYFRTLYL